MRRACTAAASAAIVWTARSTASAASPSVNARPATSGRTGVGAGDVLCVAARPQRNAQTDVIYQPITGSAPSCISTMQYSRRRARLRPVPPGPPEAAHLELGNAHRRPRPVAPARGPPEQRRRRPHLPRGRRRRARGHLHLTASPPGHCPAGLRRTCQAARRRKSGPAGAVRPQMEAWAGQHKSFDHDVAAFRPQLLEPGVGIEPTTSSLQERCSAN